MRITIDFDDARSRDIIVLAAAHGLAPREWAREVLEAELQRHAKREGHAAVSALIGQGHVADNWREELRHLRSKS